MPELPEVEITRRGIAVPLTGRLIDACTIRNGALRWPVPVHLAESLPGQTLRDIDRRAKYLLLRLDRGTLIIHLGMSGSLRVLPSGTPPEKHDHIDIVFGDATLRLRDPRRFGAMLWHDGPDARHPLLAHLGPEPLGADFSAEALASALAHRRCAIKLAIMDSAVVVGVGNIYASESLFRARIRPGKAAHRLTGPQIARLADEIRQTLRDALAAGGSTLRDFLHTDGQPGYFQQSYFVYGRDGEACRVCGTAIRSRRLGNRSTFFCTTCQR
ncbi:DNA-formamidopyrimidine glycosylase [Methyloversatilis sp. RAC08]|uniref:bifunctional DNA-formamidopyrimidine glycosylase/DNA-(apurinic or apyrimidinic site) lyase n=1 Tax=Methyloversatilis sp. RAC08 TaxID=1842540 RepID=UPI00083D8E32|nr:bifunctional DNA-formamidopyrimidine glycosylase/DNA-(apurinic or apyrimidinic site) lyase [Methyloversatilis sp. RAC08]AOF81904.1 DNA-formamidopyrimidine glycosylase [Methyloversatilis sp. RAC08]